jgi:hypothetical protein
MPYCSRCGVEVDDYIKICPLCNLNIQNFENAPAIQGNFPNDDITSKDYYIPFEIKKKITWSIFSFLIVTTLSIIFAVNFLLNRTITWGWIPLFSLLLTWALTAVIYYLNKKIYYLLISVFIIIIIYLFFLFFVIQYLDIFFKLAMPILTVAFINLVFIVLFCNKTRKKGYNIIGFILTGTASICIGIDIIVTYYITSKIVMTWSIVVISLLIPIVLFLYYIHYVLKWAPDIRKIFHI